jgi:flagella basal body P-ring formation protein FlgA
MSAKQSRVRSRVRTQWLALAAALVVLAGVLVAWALSNAADRVQVVRVTQAVSAGEVISAADLTVVGVAFDAEVQGLVPAASLDALVGRVAAVDLEPGVLLVAGMWRDAPETLVGEEAVGAVLRAGRFPLGLARGDVALAAPVDAAAAAAAEPVSVRVIDVQVGVDGELSVTLAVAADSAVAVAQLAATDQLLLVGQPATAQP